MPGLRRGLPKHGQRPPAGKLPGGGQRKILHRRTPRRPHPQGLPLLPHYRPAGAGLGAAISGAGTYPQSGRVPRRRNAVRLAGLPHGAGLGRNRRKGRVHRDRGGQRLPSGGGTGHHSLPRAESGHFFRCRGGAGSPSAPRGKPGLFPGHPHWKRRSGYCQAHAAFFRRSQSDAPGRDASAPRHLGGHRRGHPGGRVFPAAPGSHGGRP